MMQLHFSPSMRSITISTNNGFIDFMKIKVAARHISYRTIFHTFLLLAFLLPFVFILTAVVTLEGVNKCSSFGCLGRRLGPRLLGRVDGSGRLVSDFYKILSQVKTEEVPDGLKLPDSFSQLVSEMQSNQYDAKSFAIMLKATMEKFEKDIRESKFAELMHKHFAASSIPTQSIFELPFDSTMAEISEPSKPAHLDSESSNSELSQSEIDPKTMRKTKPGFKRLILAISVFSSFLLGLPFLWKSVEIYRVPLPFRDIDALSSQLESTPLQFPCSFRVIFVGFDSMDSRVSAEQLKSSILDEMATLSSKSSLCGSCSNNYDVSVVTDSGCTDGSSCSWRCGALTASDFAVSLENGDDSADDFLEAALGGCSRSDSGGKVYSVVVMNRDENVEVGIGKYRHGWIVGRISEMEAVSKVAEIFVKLFGNGGREEGLIPGEFMPVGADGKIFLSFNLLNADPDEWIYDWDFQAVDEVLLKPLIEELSPVANVSVESQVLYHTPISSFSYWDDKQESYIFNTKDLPFFVNSNEWHLDTSIAAGGRSKILHFVVYIPSALECPLRLQLPDGQISETNGFISPMWGGVIVWNPKGCLRDDESNQHRRQMISYPELEKIAEVFLGQFRQLFGLKSDPQHVGLSGTFNILTSKKGFTKWEMDFLSRQHSCFNLHSCASSLGSLSRLVQSLPRMIIMDEIGKQVKYSLEAANLAQRNASLGVFDAAAISSRQARSLAEDAFFHPSIMSVSYFSFEHCFAVYSPFFLPVALHVILAALREWKRYKQEHKKYLAFLAKAKQS